MNTRRENRLEELGRVDAEKAYTSTGKKNLSAEKSRIRKELKWGSTPKWPKGYDPRKQMDPKNFPRRPETIDPQRRRREITDPTKKKKYQDLLDRRPRPIQPLRKLTPEQRERIKKHLLKTGRPKIAKKGWK